MKIVMTLLVRNAERLLPQHLEFHLSQGVDLFIITDNLSVDGTRDIIEDYARRGLAVRIWEPAGNHDQGPWVTRMARLAAERYAPDWIMHSDDDEFWFAPEVSLKDAFASVPPDADLLEVSYWDHPPVASMDGAPFFETMIYRDLRGCDALGVPHNPKICHRPFGDIKIAYGNHSAKRFDGPLRARPTDLITISHFPIRDYGAFERKITTAGMALAQNPTLHPEVAGTWKRLHRLLQEGRLREWYDQLVLTPDRVARGLSEGVLGRSDFVARTLAGLDAPAGAPSEGRRSRTG